LRLRKIVLCLLLALLCTSCQKNLPGTEAETGTGSTETTPAESIAETGTQADTASGNDTENPAETESTSESTAESEQAPGTGDAAEEETSAETNGRSIPEIHLTLPWGATVTDYRPLECRVIDTDGRELNVSGTIKVRGNSTAGGAKKPFNLKFDRKVTVLGMERSKRWVLIANCFDKSMLRNRMAFDFAEALNIEFTPDSMFVDVYLAGKYQGVYLLCEDITVDESRVNIDPENGDYLIELESVRNDSGEVYVKGISGMRFKVKEPDPEELSKEQKESLARFLIQCDSAAATKNFEKISALFDIDSFVDMYLFKEIYKDVDGKYSSLFFYIRDGIVYAGPVWDHDLSCGNANNIYTEDKYQSYSNMPGYEGTGSGDSADGIWMQFGWFKFLMQCEEFKTRVTERYKELYPLIKNQFLDNDLGQNRIDALREEYAADIERNNALWDVTVERALYEWHPMLKNYDDYIIFYRNWFIRRINFLNGYFGVEDTLPEESPYTE